MFARIGGVRGCVVVPFHQPFRPPQPASHRGHQPGVHHEVHGGHCRRTRRLGRMVVDQLRVEILERAHGRLEITVPVRRLGSQLQPFGARRLGAHFIEQPEHA